MMAHKKRDLAELTGDPFDEENEERVSDAPDPRRVQALEKAARDKIERVNAQLAESGQGVRSPLHDETADEYLGAPLGLSDELKEKAFEFEMRGPPTGSLDDMFRDKRHASRQDFEQHDARVAWTETLHEDFIAEYPYLADDMDAVKEAGQRVIAKWRREGSRDMARRIERDRSNFFAQVSDGGSGQRLGGQDDDDEDEGEMADEVGAFNRRDGYQ
jgi:hypothetical protein